MSIRIATGDEDENMMTLEEDSHEFLWSFILLSGSEALFEGGLEEWRLVLGNRPDFKKTKEELQRFGADLVKMESF
jgi:hypothetical protein